MTQFYLIRHGRTAWNDEGRLQGWADEPLDALGQAQARALGEWLRPVTFAALYSSPLQRARATAEAVAAAQNQPTAQNQPAAQTQLAASASPVAQINSAQSHSGRMLDVRLDDRLRERNVGEWAGLTLEEARARAPERFAGDWRLAGAPGGEPQAALVARVAAALDDILANWPTGTVAVVSHGGALSAALGYLLGVPADRPVSFSFHNTAIARLTVKLAGSGRVGSVRLISLGDQRHLDAATAGLQL